MKATAPKPPKGRIPTNVLLDPEVIESIEEAKRLARQNGKRITRSELINRAVRLVNLRLHL
jgi:hypothetical protein